MRCSHRSRSDGGYTNSAIMPLRRTRASLNAGPSVGSGARPQLAKTRGGTVAVRRLQLRRSSTCCAGSNSGSNMSETERNSEHLKASYMHAEDLRATGTLRLGAGRSQVQILSPRLAEVLVSLRFWALPADGCGGGGSNLLLDRRCGGDPTRSGPGRFGHRHLLIRR